MIDQLNLNLKNFGQIATADIDIGKVNIVGGLNSTGKSTCSKILYSLLRSNSKSRKRLSETRLVNEVFKLGVELFNFSRMALDEDEDDEVIRDRFDEIINDMKTDMSDNVKPEDFGVIDYFEKLKKIYRDMKIKEDYKKILDNSLEKVQKLVDVYNEDGNELFKSIMNPLIKREFGKNIQELNDVRLTGKFNDQSFDYKLNISSSEFDITNCFIVDEVFYFDSFSVFDLVSRGGLQNTEHVNHIFQSLDEDSSSDWGDEIINDNLIEIEQEIMEITGGRFVKDDKNVMYISSGKEFLMKNTSSGIKHLGVIQMLLNNRKLVENSFLIIDEPEVNLHPELQINFAKIITLLVNELNVTVYINTHSPLFIEAIRTYSETYNLLKDTNFYLSDESEVVDGKFDIIPISIDDLDIIYTVLGEPYAKLNKISIENELKL